MAKIKKFKISLTTKNTKKISSVDMEIAKSEDDQYLVLSTFGSETRKEKDKASQILHVDKSAANQLISILQDWIAQ